MGRKVLKLLTCACLMTLLCCKSAYADVGTCFVLRGSDAQLEGEFFQKTAQSIYDAYARSFHSSESFVFVFDIMEPSRPKGSYAIQPADLVLGPWTLRGYRITAPDVSGIKNGAAEIVSALKTGEIYRLQSGRRDGPVDTPLTRDPSPNDTSTPNKGLVPCRA
jgi:hypothetical protein